MNYSRREIMRGLSLGAGSALLTPLLRQLQLQAGGAQSAFPSRFVFVVKSSGIVPEGVTPPAFQEMEAHPDLFNADLTKAALPKSMRALEPFKDQLFVRFLPGIVTCMVWLYIVLYNLVLIGPIKDCRLSR